MAFLSSGINSTDSSNSSSNYIVHRQIKHGYFRVHFDRAEMCGQIVHIDGDGS